jgi:hypothetical protein
MTHLHSQPEMMGTIKQMFIDKKNMIQEIFHIPVCGPVSGRAEILGLFVSCDGIVQVRLLY